MKRIATPVLLTAGILFGGGLNVIHPLQAEASTSQVVQQTKVYTTTDNLNLRSGASTKYKKLITIPKGKSVTYLSKSGSWYKVKYAGKTGFVSSTYIKVTTKKITSPGKPVVKQDVGTKVYTTTNNLNLRSGASTKYKTLLTIPKGKSVSYLSKSGSWYKVKYEGKTGFVSSTYIKVSTAQPTSSVKPVTPPTPTSPSKPEVPAEGGLELGSFYTVDSLNVRKGAGIEYGVITTLPRGTKVDQIGANGNWYQIKSGTKIGWVNASYLSPTKLADNVLSSGVKWLESEGNRRTAEVYTQMLDTSLSNPFSMPTQGRLTSPYGIRSNPTAAGYEFHTGIDLANVIGTPILATAPGVVDRTVTSNVGYGNYIILRHDMAGMTFYSLYGHLNKIEVKTGQKIGRGERIAQMGTTGRSTGSHLHFEIQNASRQNVDPQIMLNY